MREYICTYNQESVVEFQERDQSGLWQGTAVEVVNGGQILYIFLQDDRLDVE